jgi:hypothetical protein
MISNIQNLKEGIMDPNTKVSDLLRQAKLLASELNDKTFVRWADKELNGYSEKFPKYRLIKGEPKGWNPALGWRPIIFSKDGETQKLLSEQWLYQSVSELENLISSSEGTLIINYTNDVQITLGKLLKMSTKYGMMFPTSRVIAVLDIIRNKILDWLIKVGNSEKSSSDSTLNNLEMIFPKELIKKLPPDLKIFVDDFNFNFSNNRPRTSMLILRRILPLAIVRKYQSDKRESEIKDTDGEYLETKNLLGKIKPSLSQANIYNKLNTYKQLSDGAQHSYTLNIHIQDVRNAGIAMRVFLDDIF